MTPYWSDDMVSLHLGDCLEVLAGLPDCSVDAVVTDPPYGLEFMGREWDTFKPSKARIRERVDGRTNPAEGKSVTRAPESYTAGPPFQQWCRAWASQCLRVLKPGGHLLAFGGTRTYHRLACGIEDAGFEIRDSVADLTGIDGPALLWIQGSGFPKSHSVHKATLSAVELRYGSARCDCLDARDGHADRDRLGCEGGSPAGHRRGSGQVPADQAWDDDLSLGEGRDQRPVRQLRADDTTEAAGQASVAAAVLQPGVRGRGPEAPGLGDASLWAGLEEPASGDPAAGQGMPGLREDAAGERRRVACASSAAVPVRGVEPAGEPSGAVRSMSSRDRGDDGSGAGLDSGRRKPRELVLDDHRGGQGALVRVCSWCGLPDDGWLDSLIPLGTALKPAWEPVAVGRKALAGTVAANVVEHDTGALNIDACRVEGAADNARQNKGGYLGYMGGERPDKPYAGDAGRWPPNVLLSEEAAAELDAQSGVLTSGANPARRGSDKFRDAYGDFTGQQECTVHRGADTGGASRFFPVFRYEPKAPASERPRMDDGTAHPTVKPVDLMRWLVRLVTPPGGLVLDPFAGSGTTGEACIVEGFRSVLIERDPRYADLIVARLSKPIQPDLFGGAA